MIHFLNAIMTSIQPPAEDLLHAGTCDLLLVVKLAVVTPFMDDNAAEHYFDSVTPCRLGRPPRASAPIEFEEREEVLQGMTMTPPPHMFEELSDDQAAAVPADQQEEA